MPPLDILHIDNHLIVVRKPHGILVQADKTGDPTLFAQVQQYIKTEFNKPGNVFLGLVHRLDRPVSGVVVFARTSKAASRLSEQFRTGQTQKKYLALVKGSPADSATLENYIERRGSSSRIVKKGLGKYAALDYQTIGFKKGLSLLDIDLQTGRHHQIRVQLANIGHPIIGDFRYGSKEKFPNKSIALHAYSLSFFHPVKKNQLIFTCEPDCFWPINKQC